MTQPFLSVVIPAFNEEARILSTLEQVTAFLKTRSYAWEIVVADDGSIDATGQLVSTFAAGQPEILLLSLEHRGKGWAVKQGMLAASGQYRFLCDADLSMPIEQIERFLPPRVDGVDIVVGSREVEGSRRIGEPGHRHLMGRFFNGLIQALAVPGIRDTQCGFKCFRGEVAENLFRRQTVEGFAFDVETLYLGRRMGLTIREIGIDWHYREGSKVRPFRDSLGMTWDVLKIRYRLRSQAKPGQN